MKIQTKHEIHPDSIVRTICHMIQLNHKVKSKAVIIAFLRRKITEGGDNYVDYRVWDDTELDKFVPRATELYRLFIDESYKGME